MTMSLKNRLAVVLLWVLAASVVYGQNAAPELNITLGEQTALQLGYTIFE